MGYHIQDDFQSHLVQSMIKLGPHTLYMNRLLVFGSRALGPWDPIFGSYNNTRCWLMQRLFCSDIGHYTREDTNPVFPVVQESQFSSAIGESNKLVLNIILGIFTSVMVCRNTFLDDQNRDFVLLIGRYRAQTCFIWKSEIIRLCRQGVRKNCRWACVQSFVLTLNMDTKNPVSIRIYFCFVPLKF